MHTIYSYSILQNHGIYIALIFQNDELTLQKNKIKIYEPKNLFYIQKYQTRVDEIVSNGNSSSSGSSRFIFFMHRFE